MSRVAKAPITLPKGVIVTVDKNTVVVKGPQGELKQNVHPSVEIVVTEGLVSFMPSANAQDAWALAGTTRALVNNMVVGVSSGFVRTLELVGVGYRAQVAGTKVSLSLGFSHPVEYVLPKGVSAETPNNTTIVLKGSDKQLLGQTASEIRAYRPPEPYKGKGVKYAGEYIARKEAKKK